MPADPNPIVESMEGLDSADPHPAEEGDPYHNRRTTFTAQEIEQIKRLLQEAADEPLEETADVEIPGEIQDGRQQRSGDVIGRSTAHVRLHPCLRTPRLPQITVRDVGPRSHI